MLMCVVCAFSLRRESPDVILGDKPLISDVVLSQLACTVRVRPAAARPKRRTGMGSAAHVCAQRAHSAVRLEHVSWHGSRLLTGGYPTAKLCMEVDLSDGASPGMAWPETEAVDRPR
jgi:hypothetical protein